MRVLGIDLGSRRVKVCQMKNGIIEKQDKFGTVDFYKNYCKNIHGKIQVDFEKLGFLMGKLNIATGYGRNNMSFHGFEVITELKAHTYGAMFSTDLKNFSLLDMGGQDVKLIKVEKGIIVDMELNEKCAASCGRYLENMANVLEVSLDELSDYYENPVKLNSTCAIFSESELIGEISKGRNIEELCAGINYSLYTRLKPMLNRFTGKTLLVSGGVAKNKAIIKYLGENYDEVIALGNSDFVGTVGCCHFGQRKS
jgi:predicted CoA-substrate-specific enzyme activase